MARIVVISKFPPIEGGIAAKTYWFCKALAERGHIIHIVTNRIDADPEYSINPYEEKLQLENITIHRPSGQIPWHVPNDHHVDMELLDCAIRVARDNTADIIDTGYLVPYGLIGFLTSRTTGIPYLLRHGGSDINKFLRAGLWADLLREVFSNAAVVITDRANHAVARKLSNHICLTPPYVPNPHFYKPLHTSRQGKPILALIGKTNYYWRHKGWHRVVDLMRRLKNDFDFVVVSQGIGLKDFKKYVREEVRSSVEWRPFIHPSGMPELINEVDGAFMFFNDLPYPAFSNLVPEVLYCGKTVITDSMDIIQSYKNEGLALDAFSSQILSIDGDNTEATIERIRGHFDQKYILDEDKFYEVTRQDYQNYISRNEETILSLL
jgi:glycosyltransferase involved in cell wall biosynthesis